MNGTRLLLAVIWTVLLVALFAAGCSSGDDGEAGTGAPAAASDQASGEGDPPDSGQAVQQQVEASIVFTSPVFHEKRRIPKKHTCTEISANEPNISTPLAWENLPEGAVSLALIMDSLEIEGAERVHWVMWNMPPSLTELAEGVEHSEKLPDGTAQGTNGGGAVGYLGPCPPVIVSGFGETPSKTQTQGGAKKGISQYFFKLYALDTMLDLPSSTTKADLLKAIDGHVLAVGELMGERQGQISRREH